MNPYHNYLKSVRVGSFQELLYWPSLKMTAPSVISFLLTETGGYFLQEDGVSKLILE